MRILHCCLAAFYIDNYGYQENILPKMHQLQGHDVSILASTETYLDNKKLGFTESRTYINEYNIPVTRIPYFSFLPLKIVSKLRIYVGIKKAIEDFKPDIIFIHDCQFIGIKEIAFYAKRNAFVTIYVDSHTDFINSGKNWISKNILHKIIYKWCAKKIEPYVRFFYGTLPLRVDFYRDIYGVAAEKLKLLVLGADHTVINFNNREQIRQRVRLELNIPSNDLVLISGGKIDERKKIHILLKATKALKIRQVHLIIFGVPDTEMEQEIYDLTQNNDRVYSLGWLKPDKINDYLFASDLAIFPGTHSVIWEQAIGLGLPCVFKRWKGIEHVDIGGNCLFLEDGDQLEIQQVIQRIIEDNDLLQRMKENSLEKGLKEFSYFEIAKRAIEF